jgi:beta-glucanase (GH16 family)
MRSAVAAVVLLMLTSLAAAEETKWKLVFSDEFDGTKLDTSKWTPRDPWGYERNQELQAYVEDAFDVRDGILHIRAEKRHAQYAGKDRAYTSGMMTTHDHFAQKFGRFEVRCRVPKGQGLWPAVWLLPLPRSWPPEIDILEILGHEPNKVHMTHHWRGEDKKLASDSKAWKGPDFSADFHVFAVEWTPQYIAWSIDGHERQRSIKHIPVDKPMYLLINLAVGGNWPKAPDEHTVFPATFDIDYVRIYAADPSP